MGDAFFGASLRWGALFILRFHIDIMDMEGVNIVGEAKKPVGGNKVNIANALIEGALVPVALHAANKIIDGIEVHKENNEAKVIIPDLYLKDYPIKVEQAKILLNDCGLKFSESPMTINDANKKYRNCFDGQVISSRPKQGTAVKQDAIIYLKYITKEVIDASQKIFEEDEKAKAELKERKALIKQERKDQRKEKVSEIVDKTKNTIGHVFKKGEFKDEKE